MTRWARPGEPWPAPDGVVKATPYDVSGPGPFAAFACDAMAQIKRRAAMGLSPSFAGPMDGRRFAAKRALVSLEAEGVDRKGLAALARVARWAEEGGAPPMECDLDAAEPLVVRLVRAYEPQSSPGPMRPDLRAADAAVPDMARMWLEAIDGL